MAALIVVIEDVIRLLDLFEFLRGVRRVVDVRMVFLREFAVGAFDFVFGRGFRDTEHLIIIAFLFCHIDLLIYARLGAHIGAPKDNDDISRLSFLIGEVGIDHIVWAFIALSFRAG